MASAPRDPNRVPTLIGVSNADGDTPITVYVDPTTHRLYVDTTVSGLPTAVTDNEAVDAADTGNLAMGTDNTNYQILHTDSSGDLQVDVLTMPSVAVTNAGLTDLAAAINASNQMDVNVVATITVPVSGTFWQATQPVSGTFWQATQPVSGTFWQATQPVSLASVPSHAVTNAGTFVVQATLDAETTKVIGTVNQGTSPWVTNTVGTIADDSTTPGNPVMVGGFAVSPDGTTPGAVAEADVARFRTDLNRRLLVNDDHPGWWSYHLNTSTAQTDTAVAADPGDGFQLVITDIQFSNGAATAINMFLEEGASTIWGPVYLEAINGRGYVWKGKKHVTASTALTITTSSSTAHSVEILGYIQAV